MPDEPVPHVCSLDEGGPWFHPCRKVAEAMREANITHTRHVFDRNRPFGLLTTGKRPGLKELSGQEKLPVLELADGTTVSGSGDSLGWVARQRR